MDDSRVMLVAVDSGVLAVDKSEALALMEESEAGRIRTRAYLSPVMPCSGSTVLDWISVSTQPSRAK